MNIWAENDYKEIIKAYAEANSSVRGYGRLMADACQCKPAYLSQVINSHVHLTPDHAVGLSNFWRLDNNEAEYFLNLVLLARSSGDTALRFFKDRIRKARQSHENLAELRQGESLSSAQQIHYYSHWSFAAIHLLITIKNAQTVEAIADKLALSPNYVLQVLKQLEEMELVRAQKNLWQAIRTNFHVDKSSPLVNINHANWRQLGILEMQEKREESMHFTAVYSLSKQDYEQIKTALLEMIRELGRRAQDSVEEELYALTIDSFVVGKTL